MEHTVLERLDWRLSAVTPHDWLEVLLCRSQFSPEVSHALRHDARHFIDMALTRYVSLGFSPSLIASAALLNAADYAAPALPLTLIGRLPAVIVHLLRLHNDRRLFKCTRMLRRIIVALTQQQQQQPESEDEDNADDGNDDDNHNRHRQRNNSEGGEEEGGNDSGSHVNNGNSNPGSATQQPPPPPPPQRLPHASVSQSELSTPESSRASSSHDNSASPLFFAPIPLSHETAYHASLAM